jgi:hypothetical protein
MAAILVMAELYIIPVPIASTAAPGLLLVLLRKVFHVLIRFYVVRCCT